MSLEDRVASLARSWVGAIQNHHRLAIGTILAATVALGIFTALTLGVNMDNKKLLSPDLPFQKAARAYGRYFPSLDDGLLIVLDAQTPEQARASAQALADKLREDRDTFRDVYIPGGDPFFQRHGLLYRSPEELDDFVDHVALVQPILADLSRDASIGSLSRIIQLGLKQARTNPTAAATDWPAVLDKIGVATVRVFDEYPISVSWEDLMVEGTALDIGTRQTIVLEPVLEFGKILAAQNAIAEIRSAAQDLGLTPDRGIEVRITGNPALNYEEMIGLAWDIGVSTFFSLAIVVALLYAALRSMRLVSAAAITLVVGLIWTAAFAAATVGQLNVLSIAFAVLFIGLGVDFAIHLGMQYVDTLNSGTPGDAMQNTLQHIVSALVLCAITTAIGFLAFYPTGYRGVAELGLISGGGMFITLFQTFTLFPALVSALLGDHPENLRPALPLRLVPPRAVTTHPGWIVAIAIALAIAALLQLPHMKFDINVVEMRDPKTESVQAFKDLLARSETSPWYIDVLTPDLEAGQALAERARDLDVVSSALTLADYVPADQDEKRQILETVAMLLEVPIGESNNDTSTEQQVSALRDLRNELDADWLDADSPLGRSALSLRKHLDTFLARVGDEAETKAALAELQKILLGNFTAQFDRLREAADPPLVELKDLPRDLSRRMVSDDGHARVQIFPSEELATSDDVARFVDTVRELAPDATGVAVNLLELGRATSQSLRQALTSAFVAIAILLLLLWRRIGDTLLVLAPLLLGAILNGGLMVALDIQLNFANVVVLPLLIGIGVDCGIHLVYAARDGKAANALLESVTARAVFFSTMTTTASFGSLSLSSHRGISTLGMLLVFGILIILVCNLVVLPALITLRQRAGASD